MCLNTQRDNGSHSIQVIQIYLTLHCVTVLVCLLNLREAFQKLHSCSSDLQIPFLVVEHASHSHPESHIGARQRQIAEPAVAQHGMEEPLDEPQQVGFPVAPVHPWQRLLQDFVANIDCAA